MNGSSAARVIALVLFAAFGLVFLSRSCAISRPGGPLVLMHGRIVNAAGGDQATRFVAITGGKIAAVSFTSDPAALSPGGREIDVAGLYIAATTFDREAPKLIDGIRHVWIGQLRPGDPGDVVIMRSNPSRIRAGYVPDTDSIVGAVVDGVYYSARELIRSPRSR